LEGDVIILDVGTGDFPNPWIGDEDE
jgi:hypothetical protein